MLIFRVAILLSPIAFAGLVPVNAPVPPGAGKQEYYYPTKVGTRWVYKSLRKAGDTSCGQEIIKSEYIDGSYYVSVRTTSSSFQAGEDSEVEDLKVDKTGIYVLVFCVGDPKHEARADPPWQCLKLPFVPGAEWHTPKQYPGEMNKWVSSRIEAVRTPAGTFQAIRVDHGPDHTVWYAPNAGCVQMRNSSTLTQMVSFSAPNER